MATLPQVVEYNGYTFGNHSHVTVSAEMVEDDAGRTIVYHRYRLRVEATIVAEAGDSIVGHHFQRIRQRLSKQGQNLYLNHAGFGPALNINASDSQPVHDVAFGPKPKVLIWNPVGETNSVEVTWECEFCMPTCEGLGGVRFAGLMALNYGISYRIDQAGFTTRTISGYLEIAMTRRGYAIPDTADNYRSVVVVPQPVDYTRETSWDLSHDKRRATFSITDAQIRSPNAYPTGVIKIRANHRVGWNRRQAATLRNTISATIQLAANQPRGYAWDIFRGIVSQRIGIALAQNGGEGVFLETLDVDEELFEYGISIAMSYRIIPSEKSGAIGEFFTSSGLFTSYRDWTEWEYWQRSIASLQSHRGISGMSHDASQDQIVDLCTDTFLPETPSPYFVPQPPPTTYFRLCNEKPSPAKSYVRFDAAFSAIEDYPTVQQISIGGDDLKAQDFDPNDPTASYGDTDASKKITRFIEEAPAGIEFQWIGYCERLGYDIPKPGRLTFGNVTLVRKGRAHFRKKYIGKFFCQPLYAAAWNLRYVVERRPVLVSTDESDPHNTPPIP